MKTMYGYKALTVKDTGGTNLSNSYPWFSGKNDAGIERKTPKIKFYLENSTLPLERSRWLK